MLCAFVDSTITALVIAAMQSNRFSIFLPNYSKAILSARRIFKLLDTQPVIDSYSSDGLKLVSGNVYSSYVYKSKANVAIKSNADTANKNIRSSLLCS